MTEKHTSGRPGRPANRKASIWRERVGMLAPFVIGGLAALWQIRVADGGLIVGAAWAVSALAIATCFLLLTTTPSAEHARPSRVKREREGSKRWEARPFGSLLIRIIAVLAPIGVSLLFALAVQRSLPPPEGPVGVIAQAVLLMVAAFAILYPAERATRKLAPIATLLKLSLSFPSVAPSRFVVARRSANVDRLRSDLDERTGNVAGTMLSLVTALTAHDSRTRGHSERVRVFAEMLAEELELPEPDRERLRWAALLHDIGKLSVSSDILGKPARLDLSQWEVMYRHPEEGAKLIAPIAPWLGEWAGGVVEHHERWDGSGYPRGLRETHISLSARIIAVADAYDTMVTPRNYRKAMAASAAREEVVRVAGRQFDPTVVRALLSVSIPRLWWRIGLGAWLAQLSLLRPITRKSNGSSAGGVASGAANFVGIAAIAAAAVLAPLGSVQSVLPRTPGLSAEASTPDGTAPSQAGEPPATSPDSPSSEGPQALSGPAPAADEAPATTSEEPGKAAGGGAVCVDEGDPDEDEADPGDVGSDPDDADDADSACGAPGDSGDPDDAGDGAGPGSSGAPSGGAGGGTSSGGTSVEANQDATSGSGGSAGGATGSGTGGGGAPSGGSGGTSGGGTSSEANSDATFPSPSPT